MQRPTKLPLRIRNYEKKLPSHREYIEKKYSVGDDGFAVIELNNYDGLEWYEPLSFGDQRELNPEIFSFIDAKAYTVPIEYPLRINVMNCCLDPAECNKISQLISEHYAKAHWESLIEIRHNKIVSAVLTVLGVVFLAFAIALQSVNVNRVFSEMAMIVATFTFWEAASHWMLVGADMRLKRLYSGQLATADVVFCRNQ